MRPITPSDLPDSHASSHTPTPLVEPETNSWLDGRYKVGRLLGKGAMGEVRLCHDCVAGRTVAVKTMTLRTSKKPELRRRFERECLIQAQLEHPSIVPVHEISQTKAGVPYFVMKRVHGKTLADVITKLRQGDLGTERDFPRSKLLAVFASACQAVAFAHSRGVVHRDLKPSNIIVGDFGEVYVIDWGVAKILDPEDEIRWSGVGMESEPPRPDDTGVGVQLGSPGYMPPEQALGRSAEVTPAADVYALGTILFEVLTLDRMHTGDTTEELLDSTLRIADRRPSERAPNARISEPLDELCVHATQLESRLRFKHAGELVKELEKIIHDDAERERRREAAQKERIAARIAMVGTHPGGVEEARAVALRRLNTALVLDPDQPEATETMLALLMAPAREAPPEVQEQVNKAQVRQRRISARRSAPLFMLASTALLLWLASGVRQYWVLAPPAVLISVTSLYVWQAGERGWNSRWNYAFSTLLVAALAASFALFVGPLLFVPTLLVALAFVSTVNARSGSSVRVLLAGIGCLALAGTIAVGQLGYLPVTHEFTGDALIIRSETLRMTKPVVLGFIALGSLLCVILPVALVGPALDSIAEVERQLLVRLWRLRALVPDSRSSSGKMRAAAPVSSSGERTSGKMKAAERHSGRLQVSKKVGSDPPRS
ncbi:MAG: serine/threonine-protein kinase [Polyangiaceae bacterium]